MICYNNSEGSQKYKNKASLKNNPWARRKKPRKDVVKSVHKQPLTQVFFFFFAKRGLLLYLSSRHILAGRSPKNRVRGLLRKNIANREFRIETVDVVAPPVIGIALVFVGSLEDDALLFGFLLDLRENKMNLKMYNRLEVICQ